MADPLLDDPALPPTVTAPDGGEPVLTAAMIEDPDEVCSVLTRWVELDPDATARQIDIERQTAFIRDSASDADWSHVAEVLSTIRQRDEDLAVLIAQRAFGDGVRDRMERRRAGVRVDELPVMSEEDLGDSGALAFVIDAVLLSDDGVAFIARQIEQAWVGLQQTVSRRAWKEIDAIGQLARDRDRVVYEILLTYAFEQGRRAERAAVGAP